MGLPVLVVVSGPAGTGKTTLAHALAGAIGCPAICRDEIKEGMVHAHGPIDPVPGHPLDLATLHAFFDTLDVLVSAGVTVVAEAAFQHHVWHPNLERFAGRADLRIVQCHTDPQVARQRMVERSASRTAHADSHVIEDPDYAARFSRLTLDVPTVRVDTTNGYDPDLATIVDVVGTPG